MTDTLDSRPGRGAPGRKRKPGAGRKAKGESPYTEQVLVRLSGADVSTLDAYASMRGVSRQDIIREAVAAWCREKQFV